MAGGRDALPGVLYAGLMLTGDGPKVLEFNARFGDPETQAILQLWQDDLLAVLAEVARGGLPEKLTWSREEALCLVLASGGHPGRFAGVTPFRFGSCRPAGQSLRHWHRTAAGAGGYRRRPRPHPGCGGGVPGPGPGAGLRCGPDGSLHRYVLPHRHRCGILGCGNCLLLFLPPLHIMVRHQGREVLFFGRQNPKRLLPVV